MVASSLVFAVSCGVIAGVLVYDVKRLLAPRLLGERPWRAGRAAATVSALLALVLLMRGSGTLWVRRFELLGFVLACGVVLRCSGPLKRMVAEAVMKRRDGGSGW